MKTTPDKSNYMKLIIGVTAISFSPLAVKLVTFTSSVSAFYRSFYAAFFFIIMALLARRDEFGVNHYRWVVPSIIAGVSLGIDLEVWHKTIIFLGAGPATFLGNSQIIFVTLFAAVVFREKIPLMYYITVALVMSGLYLLTPSSDIAVGRTTGYMMGLVVGVTYAGMLISLRYAKSRSGADRYPEFLSLSMVFASSALVIALYAVAAEGQSLIVWDLKSHIIMMGTALLCQTLGWYLINNSITRIPAHEGSLFLILQPLLATVWGCILFSEPIGIVQIIGIAMTVTGITVYQLRYSSGKSEVSTEVSTDEMRVGADK